MQREAFETEDEVAHRAAAIVVETVGETPDLVLCLPAGKTPIPIYRELVALHRQGKVSFAHARIFLVDEFVGIGTDEPGSFVRFLREHLLDHIDADPGLVHLPDGLAPDPDAEASRFDALIEAAGGIDLLLLGVGANGHVGFNEPGSLIDSRTRVVDLAPWTIEALQVSFAPERPVPARGITIGLSTMFEASAVLLVACGASKAEPVRQLFAGGEIATWPVAALGSHPYLSVLIDRAATGENFTIG
ncbi:MAG: glucosamine-6-phosphate deaminase [Cucumibacter sp.]